MSHLRPFVRANVTQQIASRRWYYAGGAFLTVLLVGWYRGHTPFFAMVDGAMLACMIAFHFGIAYDRRSGFDHFASNFLTLRETVLVKTISATILIGSFFLLIFVLTSLLAGSLQLAAWHTLHALTFLWLAAPLVLLVEVLLDFTAPAALTVVVFLLVLGTMILRTEGGVHIAELIGLKAREGSFDIFPRVILIDVIWSLLIGSFAIAVWAFRRRKERISFRA